VFVVVVVSVVGVEFESGIFITFVYEVLEISLMMRAEARVDTGAVGSSSSFAFVLLPGVGRSPANPVPRGIDLAGVISGVDGELFCCVDDSDPACSASAFAAAAASASRASSATFAAAVEAFSRSSAVSNRTGARAPGFLGGSPVSGVVAKDEVVGTGEGVIKAERK